MNHDTIMNLDKKTRNKNNEVIQILLIIVKLYFVKFLHKMSICSVLTDKG